MSIRYFTILVVFIQVVGYGQLTIDKTVLLLPQEGDTILFDSGFVVKKSLIVPGYDSMLYRQLDNQLIWMTANPKDSIELKYKRLHYPIYHQLKDKKKIFNVYQQSPFKYVPNTNKLSSDYSKLNTVGNISRGIGLGNTQNVVVNSNLNLRLNGKLADDIDVLAVISDENNPIQPEGNTQQIQDFDKVFITLNKDKQALTFGDFLMNNDTSSYFMKYYKKSRGLQLKSSTKKGDWLLKTTGEVALSRGRFSRNRISGIEGNSGPYRLKGDNDELFIIIISGTEVVYVDGKKLVRGEDNDYVINYNTGEITFTPRVLITAYSRIVVEFQYSDRNYGRTVSHFGTSATNGRVSFYANGFNEMDLKSQPFLQTLSDTAAKINALQLAGDQSAIYENARLQQAYNPERIMYTKEIIGTQEVYRYASDPSEENTFYEVFFTNVGVGNGSYVQSISGANGKVFEYTGEGLGDYAPFEILIAPKRLNTANIGFKIMDKHRVFGAEYSISSLDKNTFSSVDDKDNIGSGLKIYQTASRPLKDSSKWNLTSRFDYEMVTKNYNYVERYRGVEFDRNWNKLLTNPAASSQLFSTQEHIGSAVVKLMKSEDDFFSNQTEMFLRKDNYTGLSNKTQVGYRWNKTNFRSQFEYLNADMNTGDTSMEKNQFHRFSADIFRSLRAVKAGVNYVSEQSEFNADDNLLTQSYQFKSYNAFIQSNDTNKLYYQLRMGQRQDDRPVNGSYSTATLGRDINFDTRYETAKNGRIRFNTTLRQLDVLDSTITLNDVERTLLSRVEFDFTLFRRFLRSKTFYQVGTGQEQRREFQFLQVQAGNGVYIWNDYDSNSLKTLNEFETASELDRARADYIKIYTPVAGFITTNSTKITQTLQLNPAVFVSDKKRSFIGKFNSFSSILFDQKIVPQLSTFFTNPLNQNLLDSTLINQAQNIRTTLFYNRGNPKYSVDYTYMSSNSKILLSNGFDSRTSFSHLMNTRFSIGRLVTIGLRGIVGYKSYGSEFFANRGYAYDYLEILPRLQVILATSHRIELKAKLFSAINQPQLGGETSKNIEFGGDYRYTKVGKGTLDLGVNYIRVDYDGVPSTTLAYELLRGLQNGNNITWRLGYQQTLVNNIQVTLSYDGRSSETADVIHIGRLVARYLF